jgi:RNA polymerase sigma factor (sigma-70 family)
MKADRDFANWYRQEYPRVATTLALATRNDAAAEDATAEAFAKALERWHRVRKMERPTAWVYVVAVNQLRRDLLRNVREAEFRVDWSHKSDPFGDVEARLDLLDALEHVTSRQRMALVLRYVADLPEAEVARALGLSVGGASKLLHDARGRLGTLLEDLRTRS